MKKLSVMALLLLLGVATSFADVLFSTSFDTEDEFMQWTQINANNDESTWIFDAEKTPSKVYYKYDSSNPADDWLISPEIVPASDGPLVVRYTFYGSSYSESMEVYSGKEPTVEGMTKLEASYPAILDNSHSGYFLVDAKAGEPLRIGFRATSAPNLYFLYLCSVKVETTSDPVDLSVTEIMSPVTGEGLGSETVTVKVKNKGIADAAGFSLSFAVDSTTVATEAVTQTLAAGDSLEYTFEAKADLSAPRRNYLVSAWTTYDGDIEHGNDTCMATVRHNAPATVPYFMGFEPDEYTDGISIFNLNDDTGTWGVEIGGGWFNMARTGYGFLGYNYDRNNAGNDWAILEPIEISEPGYYVLRFWYSGEEGRIENLGVYYGSEPVPDAMTNKIVEYAPVSQSAYLESVNVLYFDSPQTVCIGFYSFSEADQNWMCVDDVSFEKVDNPDAGVAVSDIVEPSTYVRESSPKDLEFTVSNNGVTDIEAVLSVNIDGTAVKDSTITLKAQERKAIVMSSAVDGLAEGRHVLKVDIQAEGDTDTSDNTASLDFVVLGEPLLYWDFESAELPDDLTMHAEDNGTVNPDAAGDEINADGWGLFNIVENPQYGEYVLALCSWLDGTDRADRWLMLPRVSVNGDNSYFVWDASSYNASYLESYEVQISTTGNDPAEFTKVYEVNDESPTMKTRGISLAEYAGKDIYIAIRLTTANGDCLILDNIGVYGDAVATGIGSVRPDGGSLTVSGNELRAAEGTHSIVINDTSGRMIRSVKGNTLDWSSVQRGVYVITVTAADGSVTSSKIVKK